MTRTPPDPLDRRGTVGLGPDAELQVRFERHLPYPRTRVWASLVDPEQQQRFVPGVRFEAVVGSPVLFDFGEQGRAEGVVLAVEPQHLLEHTWIWPGEPPSTVRWQLTDGLDGGTVVVLVHRPVGAASAAGYGTGWHVMLDALGEHLADRDPNATPPDFDGLYALYAAD